MGVDSKGPPTYYLRSFVTGGVKYAVWWGKSKWPASVIECVDRNGGGTKRGMGNSIAVGPDGNQWFPTMTTNL